MLKVVDLTKTFGSVTALDSVSLDIDKGEFVYLIGPSGAGKTTLLRLMIRDLSPDSGKVVFDGKNIFELAEKEVPALRREIGVVFQDYKLLPERTVRENVEVPLAILGVAENEWRERIDEALNLVGILGRAEMFPAQLSGGELQRTALARALVVSPKMVIADEPTGNLDWQTAEEMINLLEKLNQEGKTVIVATHHLGIVKDHARRVVKIKAGKLEGEKTKKKKKEKENEPKDE